MSEAPETSSFESLLRLGELSLFQPFILGFTGENSDTDAEGAPPRERIILINLFSQSMVVIGETSGLETLLRSMSEKDGQAPASKASIEAMPVVEIGENEEGECVVCLEEWRAGESVKEMPCKHRFHGNCVEKWLGIHGSCPVCRYKMPVDEDDDKKSVGEEEERGRVERNIWVTFSFRRPDSEQQQPPSSDSVDVS